MALHRLMFLLCRDFYQPLSVVGAFSKLFPDEYFNPNTSPNRVHQFIRRLSNYFRKQGVAFKIDEMTGSYRLRLPDNTGILIPQEFPDLNLKAISWVKIRGKLQGATHLTIRYGYSSKVSKMC
jgi:hypothetical protein